MKVGVDARHLSSGRGIARYTRRMLGALAGGFPRDEFRCFVAGRGAVDLPHPHLSLRRDPRPQRAVFGAAATIGRPRLDQLLGGGLDVLWIPAPAPVAISPRQPYVLTVHDLSFEQRPEDFTTYERLWHRAARPRALARGAALCVAVSTPVRNAVIDVWGIAPERVRVIHPGVRKPTHGPKVFHRLPGRYFLAVGALEPRKAPDLLARAFAKARANGLDAELVFAGTGRLGGAVAGEGVHALGTVTDDELHACYANALAVVMPSWIEGFGLPPLEALAVGTPAIVSDLEVFDETIGEGALRFPTGDEDSLARALCRLASDPQLRHDLVANGRDAIAPLTWERAGRSLHAVLEEAARR